MFVVVVVACLLAPAAPGTLRQGAADARARFLEGDFAGAVVAADAAADVFEEGTAFVVDEGGWAVWADAMVTKALALRRMGKEAESDAALRAIMAVRPAWKADRSFVPPKTMARLEELKNEALQRPPVPLTALVRGKGPLLLDGRRVTPGVLDVIPGVHYLGVAGRGKKIDVQRPVEVVLDADDAVDGADPGDGVVRSIDDPDPAPVVEGDGPPWALIGVGVGVVVLAGVGVAVGLALAPPNPGGTTISVDASLLDGATP